MTFTPRTELLDAARALVLANQAASKSLLQRHLSIGYREAVDLMARLEAAGVVTPITLARMRLIAPAHRRPPAAWATTPSARHVRMLRNLALYMLDCHEYGGDGHSQYIKTLLTSAPAMDWKLVRNALTVLRDRPSAPVTAAAWAIAQIPEMAAAFEPGSIRAALEGECAPHDRPIDQTVDANEKRRRTYLQAVRYIEQRMPDGNPTTEILLWMPDQVPHGVSEEHRRTGGTGHDEHVVPRIMLTNECMSLLRSGVPVEQVASWLEPYMAVVTISQEEQHYVDVVRGWKEMMPPGWQFDRDSIFARLHQAEIRFEMD